MYHICMIVVREITSSKEIKAICPFCGTPLSQIGLDKDSIIKGLAIKCKRCKRLLQIDTK